jgi:hypothetical protein
MEVGGQMFSGEKLPKRKIQVIVDLADGTKSEGCLFASPQARLLDLLNDDRLFLPFESNEGALIFVRKDVMLRVTPVQTKDEAMNGAKQRSRAKGFNRSSSYEFRPEHDDPYLVLGISAEASPQEIRDAYHQRCREYHPDKIEALGLPPGFVEFATQRMVVINGAYEHLNRRGQ